MLENTCSPWAHQLLDGRILLRSNYGWCVRYLSVCSGIEAASVAWRSLDWHPVAFAEIEPFPCAVLKYHYPDVPNWGDITKFAWWPDACACDVAMVPIVGAMSG